MKRVILMLSFIFCLVCCAKKSYYLNKNKGMQINCSIDSLSEGVWIYKNELGGITICNYKKGLKHGMFKEFNSQGFLTETGKYRKGQKRGKWLHFNGNRLTGVFYYKKDGSSEVKYIVISHKIPL